MCDPGDELKGRPQNRSVSSGQELAPMVKRFVLTRSTRSKPQHHTFLCRVYICNFKSELESMSTRRGILILPSFQARQKSASHRFWDLVQKHLSSGLRMTSFGFLGTHLSCDLLNQRIIKSLNAYCNISNCPMIYHGTHFFLMQKLTRVPLGV